MGKLSELVIRVVNPSELAQWYKDVMGMDVREDLVNNTWSASYPGPGVTLVFKAAPEGSKKYESSRESCYWKIGVCVPDVDLARDRITRHGVSVSSPSQFMDVGYLCHLSDPSGFTIELLQHTFQQNFVKPAPDDNFVLGQVAVIGQITTRSTNIEESLQLYRDQLGMKLVSIQDIAAYGFCLYFLGFTDQVPPCDDVRDVRVREWLWQRQFTTLEIQFKPKGNPCLPMTPEGEGIDCIKMVIDKEAMKKVSGDKAVDTHKFQDRDGVSLNLSLSS